MSCRCKLFVVEFGTDIFVVVICVVGVKINEKEKVEGTKRIQLFLFHKYNFRKKVSTTIFLFYLRK